jgi:hypothetical protein
VYDKAKFFGAEKSCIIMNLKSIEELDFATSFCLSGHSLHGRTVNRIELIIYPFIVLSYLPFFG